VATLFNPEPAAYLPHRFPFLMLDRVLELKPGVSARARYRTSGSLQVFPQVLLVEAVAQLSGIAAVERQGEGGFWPLLTGLISAAPPGLAKPWILRRGSSNPLAGFVWWRGR